MSKRKNKIGLPPGTVVFTGNQKVENTQLHYMQYDGTMLEERVLDSHGKVILPPSPEDKVDWYDVRGIHDTKLLERIGQTFDMHNLVLEDISDINQRPKFEEYENGVFLTMRVLAFDKAKLKVEGEQVAFFFRKGFVVSFQETDTDIFEPVRKRIQSGRGRIRQRGADYLVYALADVIVDNYFFVLEEIEEEMEALEERILESQESREKSRIHRMKKELLLMRKSIAPLREAISRFTKSESVQVAPETVLFVRDLYDHTIQIMDMLESLRDLLNGLHDLFISEVSFKMNQVMQVLTIVSTIFIPLTFLAGIYGMNFDNIPELHWEYSYYVLWAVMVMIFGGLLWFFRKKEWL